MMKNNETSSMESNVAKSQLELTEKVNFNDIKIDLGDFDIEDVMFGRNQPSQYKCKTQA